MRDQFAEVLKEALKAKDTRRTSTVRLIQAAIKDRDIANRGLGKDPVGDDEILQILAKMIKQREEIAVINGFLPEQISEDKVKVLCADVVRDTGAHGLRDMGKCMNALKERYPGQMDFAKASGLVKDLLK